MSSVELAVFSELNDEILKSLVELEKRVFEKPISEEQLRTRLESSRGVLGILAMVDGKACGYKVGFERSADTFYSWIGGVDPDYRQRGIASSLMQEQHKLLAERRYRYVRTRTKNAYREMMILNLKHGFEITGVHHKLKESRLAIIMEKRLGE